MPDHPGLACPHSETAQALAASGATDRELLATYRTTRSHEVFAQLARRHGSMVFRTCRRLLPNVQDAEDATQAVFLLLAQKPEKAPDDLPAWLHQVARNTALMVLRSGKSRAQREERAAQMRPAVEMPAEPGLREELDAALDRLPTNLRTAVILCHLEDRNQDEAARIAGCDRSTVSRRAADGLERLRALLLRRGTVVTPVLLAAFLAKEAAAAAPASLAVALAAPKLVAAGALTATTAGAVLAKATANAMFWAKAKAVTLQTVAAMLLVTVPAVVLLKPSADLVGSYAFDEGTGTRVGDASHSGNHGTLVGGVTWTAGRKPGTKALTFDGKTGYVQFPQDLNPWLGGNATVAFWVNTTQLGDAEVWRTPAILGVNVTKTERQDILWGILDNRGRIGMDDDAPVMSSRPINDGKWHHIAFTRDAAQGECKVYLDGSFDARAATVAGIKATPFRTVGRIENNAVGRPLFFQGSLSDLKFYRVVLKADEIRKLAE
jgi:RNA polymerase sigma factor (sigma-70 family)